MKSDRLFEITYILLDRKKVTAKYLAEFFGVTTRTIYRDIETLSTSGVPIYMTKGKGGGISLLPDFVLNKTILSENDKKEILSSLKGFEAISLESGNNTSLKKLTNFLGDSCTNWIEIDFSSWERGNEEKETFNTIKNSIIYKQVVSFSYSNSKGEKITRKVEPLKLCYKSNSWYLFGHCREKDDTRFFKLRRIKGLKTLEELFEREAPENIFDKSQMFVEEFFELKLKVSKKMAYRVYDEFYEYKETNDGNFIAKIMFPKGEWLFPYIASFGEECEILEPEEAKIEIKDKLEKILKKYL